MLQDLVENDNQGSNSNHFQDALIVKKLKDGLIIQLENDGEILEGFIYNDNIKSELRKQLTNPKIIGTIIKVRFLYRATTEKRNPVYSQKPYYAEGEELELLITGENDKYIYANSVDGFEYKLSKAKWERGPKYCKQKIGTKINCRVNKVMWGNSFFDRIKIPNPYYQDIEYWVSKREIITKTFNLWLASPDNDKKVKLKEDYNSQNANYIFSFLFLLEELLNDTISRYDIKFSILITNEIINVDKKLLNSGFLLTQNQNLREETKKTIEGKILKYNHWLSFLNEILNKGIESIFDESIEITKSLFKENEILRQKIFLINFILKHLPYESIRDDQLEVLVSLLLEKKIIFIEKIPFPNFRRFLTDRRKFVRKKLFSSLNFQPLDMFEKNFLLSHFIFLKKIEYNFCFYYKELPQALLEKGSLLYYEALFSSDNNNKVALLEDSLELLKNQRVRKKDFIDLESLYLWSLSLNIIIARNYELLFSLKREEEDSIKYLIEARDFYIKAKSKRGYLIEYFIQYLSTINLIHNSTIDEIDELNGTISTIHQRIIDDLHYAYLFPILNYLNQFYSIIILIGDNNQNKLDFLLEFVKNPCKEPQGFPCIQKLARIVLANNLIIDLLNNKYPFWTNIQEFIKVGEFALPLEIISSEEELDEIDSHPIFSEENHKVEYKGSIAFHIDKFFYTKEIELSDKIRKSFLKTVVGMLNSEGGEIYIGVLELDKYQKIEELKYFSELGPLIINNRIFVGVEKEIESYNNSMDDHIRHISTILRNRIDPDIMQNIIIEPQTIKGKNIYKIIIKNIENEWGFYLDKSEFYVRENNETILYDNQKTMTFLLRKIKSKEL